jgi:hypothetical protein
MRFDTLEAALDALQSRVGDLADEAKRQPAKTQLKRYTPDEQVMARVELAGPQKRLAKVHAGVDVHGDGAVEAYLGRVRRKALEKQSGEDVISGLRRSLLGS